MNTKFTKGPLTVRMANSWPWNIETVDAAGKVVFTRDIPCHSSSDKTAEEALLCRNLPKSMSRKDFAEINARALADEHVRASAPELYEALELLLSTLDDGNRTFDQNEAVEWAEAALKKARGEA